MRHRSWIAVLAVIMVIAAVPVAQVAAEGSALPVPTTKGPVVPMPLCPDLAAKLTLDTSVLNGKGRVALHAKVCNVGTRDFAAPPGPAMRGEYQVATWHPPKTAMQEGNTSVFAGPFPIATGVPIGQCVPYEQTYAFDGVIRWIKSIHRPVLAPGERLAHKEFTFQLLWPASGYVYKQSDDCSTSNNAASVTVTYVDKK